jgi:D-alanine--poly(phosphoribitol) ligase subunit 1
MYYNLATYFQSIVEHNNNAIIYDNNVYSYDKLNKIANKIANFLLEKEIKSNDVVSILGTKTIYNYAIMLACLKIGAIYTNIDIENPIDRIKSIINTCKPKIIISDNNMDMQSIIIESKNIIFCKIDESLIKNYNYQNLDISENICGNNPAYIMFTSGSTGIPKGVVISHSSILSFIKWSIDKYKITSSDTFAQLSPLYFDNSVFDFYTALFSGASLVPIKKELLNEPIPLVEYIDKHNCSIWFSVPSLLVYLLTMRVLNKNTFKNIRIISFGGEGFPKKELKKMYQLYNDRINFINVYGPTEGTCICSSYDINENDFDDLNTLTPLGKINPNFKYFIINDDMQKVENGQNGELILGGSNIALGYYNDKGRTVQNFKQNPFIDTYCDILYKTGDIVYEKNGLLYFVGRVDNQIKYMGYRIELEEIENVINSIKDIVQSGVIYQRKENSSYGKIVAFIQTEKDIYGQDIKDILSDKLPSYMVPNKLIIIKNLPKNQNGKVDRKKLKEII